MSSALERLKAVTGDDYWDCCEDTERLTHTEALEAIEYHVDSWLDPECDVEQVIRDKFADGLTVYAWQRKQVSDSDIRDAAESTMDDACQYFSETLELGDPEESDSDGFTKAVMAKHMPAFEAAVRSLYADAHIWACEQFAKVELSCDELLELCRAELPHWFEVQS